VIQQAVEIGRVICTLDPAEAALRDERMRAGVALKPPPEPRLGTSQLYHAEDVNAGYLSVQGPITHDGHTGLFDDVVGQGWQLLLRCDGPVPGFTAEAGLVIERLSVVVATFGNAGDTTDVDGTYSAWFERLNTDAILVRPDFYVFGTSALADINALVVSAWQALQREEMVHGDCEV
jgi:hypothetical protein